MKTILISFASEDKKYKNRFYRSQIILEESAKPFFDGCISYQPSNIAQDFFENNKKIFQQERGFGYWLWKPYIINRALQLVQDNDIIFYVDAGNSFINSPECLFNLVQNDPQGIILFDNYDGSPPDSPWINVQWTKYDCFAKMNCLEPKFLKGKQINGSYILFKKTPFVVSFFDEYLNYCLDEEILTDKPNTLGTNFPEFNDHRHDQSILSLLAIKHNITVARDPSIWNINFNTSKYHYPQIFNHHRGFV